MPRPKLLSAAAALVLTSAALLTGTVPASAAGAFSFAVIGDVPYGTTQYDTLPSLINQINADSQVQLAGHVGDISSPLNCSDSYYSSVKSRFDAFAAPLVYTPGDNEWADCSRATVGAANPLDRLAAVRRIFFPNPGTTLGKAPISVTAQTGYPENVVFDRGGLTFAALNIPGSDNDLDTWTGYSAPTTAQKSEESARSSADIQLVKDAFTRAKSSGSRAVVLLTQADMFAPGTHGTTYKTAFQSTVKAIASQSASFAAPVYLVNGDTHVFKSDKPLTSSTWLSFYGITSAVPNLSRITVQGGTSEWAKFTVVSTSAVLQVQRIPYRSTPTNAAPTAAFSSSTNGLTVNVDASASKDSDGSIASYAWNFGDGSDGSGATTSHTYTTAGTYTITLSVTDNGGASGTVTHSATVTAPTPPSGGTTLIAGGADWSYLFPTSTPSSTWNSTGFDASTWKSGAAPLGWGDASIRTTVTSTASTKPLTVYYRKTVSVADASTLRTVALTTRADDGIVVYVNGAEVGRVNMPSGTVSSGTYATSAVTTSNALAKPVTLTVTGAAFHTGTNVIAAEVHSNYHSTPSSSYDLSATADVGTSSGGGSTGGTSTELPSGTTVLPAGSSWSYFQQVNAPASTWQSPGFDASSWPKGSAPLGWGTSSLATVIPSPATTRPLASYFIATFTIPTGGVPSSGLTLTTRADDGVIVFVNGGEVGRSNLPTGAITQNTYALTAPSTATAVANPVSFVVPASALHEGTNVIAAQVQSNYHATPNGSFDLAAVVR